LERLSINILFYIAQLFILINITKEFTSTILLFQINITKEFTSIILLFQINLIYLTVCVPVMINLNVDLDKLQILKDNKSKAGIYFFTNNITGKIYVGSSYNLSKRLRLYFSLNYLKKKGNMYINRT
jgi:uncharacterized membrane protein